METEIKIGQKLNVKSSLKRVLIRGNYHTQSRKEWVEVKLFKEIEVIVVGIRTISDGKIWYMGDEGTCYTPDVFRKALLVTKNINSKPFYISFINEHENLL